jgi:hypothetical protein
VLKITPHFFLKSCSLSSLIRIQNSWTKIIQLDIWLLRCKIFYSIIYSDHCFIHYFTSFWENCQVRNLSGVYRIQHLPITHICSAHVHEPCYLQCASTGSTPEILPTSARLKKSSPNTKTCKISAISYNTPLISWQPKIFQTISRLSWLERQSMILLRDISCQILNFYQFLNTLGLCTCIFDCFLVIAGGHNLSWILLIVGVNLARLSFVCTYLI